MAAWWDPEVDGPCQMQMDERGSIQDLVTQLLQLRSGRGHPAIEFVRDDGSVLSMATDGSRAFLVWINGLHEPFQSVGSDQDGPTLVFDYFGSWSEAPACDLVPLADALDSVRAFLASGIPDTPAVQFRPS
jgi:hypothetical protein